MKFPVAPEWMSAEVSMVLFFPCSVIGNVIDLLLVATSTRSRVREGDVEASSLFKNPKLWEWRFQRFLPLVLRSRW